MTSMAFDVPPFIRAFQALENDFLGRDSVWTAHGPRQLRFHEWRQRFGGAVAELPNLLAMASTDYSELNDFLVEHGFEPKFEPFNGIGAASTLNLLVEWCEVATIGEGRRYDDNDQLVKYPVFNLSSKTSTIYKVAGFGNVLCIETVSGDKLWLVEQPRPLDELALFDTARSLLDSVLVPNDQLRGAQVPMVDLEINPVVSWLCGYSVDSPQFGWFGITQAFQTVKFRMNHRGARLQSMAGVAAERAIFGPLPLVISKPFMCFTTRGEARLPIGCLWVDYDSWKAPADLDS